MRRRILIAAAILVLALVISSCASRTVVVRNPDARFTFATTISGRVLHAGHVVPGARVVVEGHGASDVTNSRGEFIIRFRTSVPAGTRSMRLRLNVSKPGYVTRSIGVTVHDGGNNRFTFSLARR